MEARRAPWMVLLLARPALTQVVTENAGTVSPDTPILRESLSFFDSEDLRETRWVHQFLFAFRTGSELKLTVPVIWREISFDDTAGVEHDADLTGLGDASLRLKHVIKKQDDIMESTRWSFLAELGAPTAEEDATEDGVEIPGQLRLGTGDWSLGAGSVFTRIRDRHRFSAEAFYRHRTRHDGLRLGPSADLNLAYWYRLSPSAFRAGEETTEVRGVLELLSSYNFASKLGSDTQEDDGTLVWLAPGIQIYPSPRTLFEANVQLPVAQDLDDALGDRRWAATVAIKLVF